MAPGLPPGDVVQTGWLPMLDHWRHPRRFERWALAATDGVALKRIVGLRGERLEIRDGDLAIDGETVLKGPRLLAEMGSRAAGPVAPPSESRVWHASPREVLDDEPGLPARSHVLLPVRDVGVAAIMRVTAVPPAGFVRVRARVGSRVVPWRLTSGGSHAVVAGRLDGRLVAAAWLVKEPAGASRGCLPDAAPERWQVAEPWAESWADGGESPPLGVEIEATGQGAVLETVTLWRDAHYRPAANGIDTWSLEPDQCFVLGDHPPSSTDSRQWGPIARDRLRHRIP